MKSKQEGLEYFLRNYDDVNYNLYEKYWKEDIVSSDEFIALE